MPAQPIIEIAGEQRMLVENHRGVSGYSSEKILINVEFGTVCVCGCGLRLFRMTREQLVIRGRIDTVSYLAELERGRTGISVKMLIKVCNVLGLSADYVLFGTERTEDELRLDAIRRIDEKYLPLLDKVIEELLALDSAKE